MTLDLYLTSNTFDAFGGGGNKFDNVELNYNKLLLAVKCKYDSNFKIERSKSWLMYLFSTIIFLILVLCVQWTSTIWEHVYEGCAPPTIENRALNQILNMFFKVLLITDVLSSSKSRLAAFWFQKSGRSKFSRSDTNNQSVKELNVSQSWNVMGNFLV